MGFEILFKVLTESNLRKTIKKKKKVVKIYKIFYFCLINSKINLLLKNINHSLI
jgi:uncharacterized protein (DUF302 family)